MQGSSKQGGSCVQLWEDAADLTGDEAVLVRCLLCRAAWGGMPGDVELLKGAPLSPSPPPPPALPFPCLSATLEKLVAFMLISELSTVSELSTTQTLMA